MKTLRVAERGADGNGQVDWISPALPPLAMIKQASRCTLSRLVVRVVLPDSGNAVRSAPDCGFVLEARRRGVCSVLFLCRRSALLL